MNTSHSLTVDASLTPFIWERWITPGMWPQDDPDTKAVAFDAPPALGVIGSVTPVSGPKSRMRVTRFEPGKAFYLETKLPLATMSFEHDMAEKDGQLEFTHRLEFTGPCAGLFRSLIGKKIVAGFPTVMASIILHAEAMQRENTKS